MKRRCKTVLFLLVTAAGTVLLLFLPVEAAAGAKNGLSVCGGVIIPSLFPFMILSRLLCGIGLPEAMAAALSPLYRRIGLSPYAAAPMLIGLLGGYPSGAAAVAEEYRSGLISREEAERILPCCNNTGPAFIIGAAGSAVFGSALIGAGLYLCHILAAFTVAVLCCRGSRAPVSVERKVPSVSPPGDLFLNCVRDAAATVTEICAFVVCFSVITALLRASGVTTALVIRLAKWSGIGPKAANALITGLLELGGGIAAMAGLSPDVRSLMLCSFLLGFGGLSVHAQSAAVLSATGIRYARGFGGRLLHGLCAALYAFILFKLLRIGI